MKTPTRKSLQALLLVAAVLVALAPGSHIITSASASGPRLLYINPTQVNNMTKDSTFTVQVKVTDLSPDTFNSWDIQVVTNPSIIIPTSIDITGNIFVINGTAGATIVESINCPNGVGPTCDNTAGDGPGVAHSSVSSSSFVSGPGFLFSITYQVVGSAPLSSIGFSTNVLFNGATSLSIDHGTQSGIYGSGQLLTVDFSWQPQKPIQGDLVNFTAIASDPNPNTRIVKYGWTFGDGSGGGGALVTTRPTITHTFTAPTGFPTQGAFLVALTVTDNITLTGTATHSVLVSPKEHHDISLTTILVEPRQDNISPGTTLKLTVAARNNGTIEENRFNVTVSVFGESYINGKLIGVQNFNGTISPGDHTLFHYDWSTTGALPGAYEIRADIPSLEYSNGTLITESNVRNNHFSLFVRIISPLGASTIPFTITQLGGLFAAALVVTGLVWAGRGRIQEKRRKESQQLA